MVKQIAINIFIIFVFLISATWVVVPFLAEMEFNAGKALESAYRWKPADERFDLAVRLDSTNAEYHRGIGKFYTARAAILKNKLPALLKAEREYEKAHALNTYSARYLMELAAVEAELFLTDTDLYVDRLGDSVRRFKEAFEKDPNNYIFNYDIGRNFLRLWDYIDAGDRQFALGRFKGCLKIEERHSRRVYQLLWDKFKTFEVLRQVTSESLENYQELSDFIISIGLWRYRREIADKIEDYKRRENPKLFAEERAAEVERIIEIKEKQITNWQGVSANRKNVYTKGNMYWTGTVDRLVYLPAGTKEIVIKALGSQANGTYPYMIIELDGEEIGEAYVNSSVWKDYRFDVNDGGLKVISASFINDGGNELKGEDRNLYLGKVVVTGYRK